MFLLPLRQIRKQMAYNRQQARAEREGLLDSVLPAPTHPRAKARALATSALAIFLLLVIWMAATESTNAAKDKKEVWEPTMQRWVWESGVEMGNPMTEDEQAQKQEMEIEALDEVDDDSEEETDGEDDKAETEMKSGLAKYIWHEDLEWDADSSGRLIIVGDVHGMINELKAFLRELDYSPDQTRHHNDTLVFVGDLVAKHPDIKSSLDTVKYIRSLNAWAVRGNHDQAVLDWRSWMERSQLEGLGTTEDIETSSSSLSANGKEEDEEPPKDVPQVLKHKWRDEHFRIAKSMSQASADWLKSRSMTLHIRSLHSYVVHAGLLPWTIPKHKGKKKKVHTQNKNGEIEEEEEMEDDPVDLDFLSDLDFTNEFGISEDSSLLESSSETSFIPVTSSLPGDVTAQKKKDLDPEMAILTVPLNREPFTLLEMRGLKKNGKVTKSTKKGEAWAPIWNQVMRGCQQSIDAESETEGAEGGQVEADKMRPGQCRPLSVIYGHAAARGLDLHPYSFGLDSGAVYGRSFSALIVNGKEWKNGHVKSKKLDSVDVAIAGRHAKVYSMKTKKPKD